MGASEKAAAAFYPDDDVPMGENPGLDSVFSRIGLNGKSGAAVVLDAAKATDAAIKHAENLQKAVNEIRQLADTEYTAYPFLAIREILRRNNV